jgi:hypothetical protein
MDFVSISQLSQLTKVYVISCEDISLIQPPEFIQKHGMISALPSSEEMCQIQLQWEFRCRTHQCHFVILILPKFPQLHYSWRGGWVTIGDFTDSTLSLWQLVNEKVKHRWVNCNWLLIQKVVFHVIHFEGWRSLVAIHKETTTCCILGEKWHIDVIWKAAFVDARFHVWTILLHSWLHGPPGPVERSFIF